MPRLLEALSTIVIATALFVTTPEAKASELSAYAGAQTVDPLSGGCCTGVPLRGGYGLGLRIENSGQVWQGFGYTDFRWAEISALKSTYLIGEYTKADPGSTSESTVTRLKRWQLIVSYGVGFFVHTTTTVRYDLPVVLNGFLGVAHLETQYALNDRYSLIGLGRLGAAISLEDKSMFAAGLGGLLYRF